MSDNYGKLNFLHSQKFIYMFFLFLFLFYFVRFSTYEKLFLKCYVHIMYIHFRNRFFMLEICSSMIFLFKKLASSAYDLYS